MVGHVVGGDGGEGGARGVGHFESVIVNGIYNVSKRGSSEGKSEVN